MEVDKKKKKKEKNKKTSKALSVSVKSGEKEVPCRRARVSGMLIEERGYNLSAPTRTRRSRRIKGKKLQLPRQPRSVKTPPYSTKINSLSKRARRHLLIIISEKAHTLHDDGWIIQIAGAADFFISDYFIEIDGILMDRVEHW